MASTADCAAWGVAGVSMLLTRAFKAASGTGALAATTFGCVTFGVATLGTVVFTVFVAPDTVLAALANEVPIRHPSNARVAQVVEATLCETHQARDSRILLTRSLPRAVHAPRVLEERPSRPRTRHQWR